MALTKREAMKAALDYATGILEASHDGAEPPGGDDWTERDESLFWEALTEVERSLQRRLARYK